MKNTFRLFVIKIGIPSNFMRLHLKMTSEICQKVASLDLRTALNAAIILLKSAISLIPLHFRYSRTRIILR